MRIQPVWKPDDTQTAHTAIARFAATAERCFGVDVSTYRSLWRWSTEQPEEFWSCVWHFYEPRAEGDSTVVLESDVMPGARWFPGLRVNYAENALSAGQEIAVIALGESGEQRTVSSTELSRHVGAFAATLRSIGVQMGDRVVGYLPNGLHAIVAFLGAASIGAVWSQCAQDYGSDGAAARFAPLEPVVLVAADGYEWNGRRHDRRAEATALSASLKGLRATVWVPNLGLDVPVGRGQMSWQDATAKAAPLVFERVPFDHPLWVLFSSGTTGQPKGIVHGHGGVLLEHFKFLGLHHDLAVGDVLFWYTTTSWMMWNVAVSGLLTGATTITYDGSPTYPNTRRLFDIAAQYRVDTLGVSPGYLASCAKADLHPARDLDLSNLNVIGSTGAPLPPALYGWVRDRVGARVQLVSTSGGTDVVSAFAGSAPTTPVWAGEISAPSLGVALESWDDEGQRLIGQVGELVITKPMPSMPVCFWDDPHQQKYRDAYFSTFPGVWRHGDWVTVTERGSVVIEGRSDATLNRHGVRLGSADIYAVTDRIPEIADSLVVGIERPNGAYWLPLFVVLTDGHRLDGALRERIRSEIATGASRRHVPDDIVAVDALPHTRTGKRLEVPVKRIIMGVPLEKAANLQAVDDPEALRYFARFVTHADGLASRAGS